MAFLAAPEPIALPLPAMARNREGIRSEKRSEAKAWEDGRKRKRGACGGGGRTDTQDECVRTGCGGWLSYIATGSQWGGRARIGDVARWGIDRNRPMGLGERVPCGGGLVLVLPPQRFVRIVGPTGTTGSWASEFSFSCSSISACWSVGPICMSTSFRLWPSVFLVYKLQVLR